MSTCTMFKSQQLANRCMMLFMLFLPIKGWAEKFVFTTVWTAQAEFAGYYVAKEKGFYKEMGLDVVIQHPTLNSSALHRLQTDQCDAAMFSLTSAIDFISQGIPLVNIFQDSMNSSNILVSRWCMPPLQMKGKKVGSFLEIESNAPIGLWEHLEFVGEEIDSIKGRPLFIYTDGLNEAENSLQQQLGDEQLLSILRDTSYNSPQQVINALSEAVANHRNGAEPNDDLTMMCIKVK